LLRCNTRIGRQEQMLDRVALFRELSSDQLSFLNARATVRTYPKGAVIVNEGDEGNSLFVIQSGTVKVYLRNDKGKELVLSTQGPDEYFGDLALFDDAPRSASVAALEACRLLVISKSVLREALTERPEIALMLLKGLASRVRILTESIRTFAFLDVFGRLVRTLHALASEKDGHLVIDQKLTQQDLANRIGASREMVSRIMNDLVEGGYIKVDSKRILICKTIPSKW
jgi:CRP/FNR family transcriptional regulator, cyclic AMP receptor protein